MKILLLSAYDAPSHRRWREGLVEHLAEHEWVVLTLPPRYFSWRVRGNSLSWAWDPSSRALLENDYDLLVATSMVDLSALRGFVPSLGRIPTLIYFHENQFSYPESSASHGSVEPQMLSLYSALCGDLLVFNSLFNQRTFFDGAQKLLKKLPDHIPADLLDGLKNRACVQTVPLEMGCFQKSNESDLFTIIWNHRWEFDKSPERLLALVKQLEGLPYRLHVVGQQFRKKPIEFDELRIVLEQQGTLGQWGFVESLADYQSLLCSCHLVLSTALHDFQGLAVIEAVASGCYPVLPNRQAYPEWFGAETCYDVSEDVEAEAVNAAFMIRVLHEDWLADRLKITANVEQFSWVQQTENYRQLLFKTIKSHSL